MKYRLIASAPGSATPLLVNGRTYSRVLGSIHDAPYSDRAAMRANGFTELHGVGTTAERPNVFPATEHSPNNGALYYDTNVAAMLAFDGAAWRDAATGQLA